MGMSRCYSLMKCLLIAFNIVFVIVGCGACAFAIWALWDGRASESGAGRAGLFSLAGWGVTLTFGALLALFGVIKGSGGLLGIALALLALCGAAEAAAACWGAAHLPQLKRALRDRLDRTVKLDYGRLHSRTQMLDAIQHGLQCCGAEGIRDWQDSAWATDAQREQYEPAQRHEQRTQLDLSVSAPAAYYWVPTSCCATDDPYECETARRVPMASRGAIGLYEAACSDRVLDALHQAARAPLAIGAALLGAHVLTLLLTLAFCLRAQPETRYKA